MTTSESRSVVARLDRAFAHPAGRDAVIDVHELQRALGIEAEYLARRVMAGFDADATA